MAHALVEAGLEHSAAGNHRDAVRLLAAADATRRRIEIATPGSEEPAIRSAWSAAEDELGTETVARLARDAAGGSIDDLTLPV